VVEIKPDKTKEKEDELTAKTIKMIKDMKLGAQCDFISFSLNICKEIKRLEPTFKVQYLKESFLRSRSKTKVWMVSIIITAFSRKILHGLQMQSFGIDHQCMDGK
jgi:glycerophosphoryl diester phosphodiesterase